MRGAGPFDTARICLCGALAAEWRGLVPAVRDQIQQFFAENEAWLAAVMDTGRVAGVLRFSGPPTVQASVFLAGLQGAMLLARARQDVTLYCDIAHTLLGRLGVDALDLYPLDLHSAASPASADLPLPASLP